MITTMMIERVIVPSSYIVFVWIELFHQQPIADHGVNGKGKPMIPVPPSLPPSNGVSQPAPTAAFSWPVARVKKDMFVLVS